MQRLGDGQGLLHPALAVLGRPLACRGLPPAGRRGIAVGLLAQATNRSCRRVPAFRQGRVPAERRRPRCGPHPYAVLRHPLQAGDPDREQCGKAVDQQLLQRRTVRDPEIRQGLGIHPDAAAQPLKRNVLDAQPRQLTGTADTLDRRVQPQRYQDPRIRRRMAGATVDRLDRSMQRRQVQPFDELPNLTHAMIGRDQIVERQQPQINLPALRQTQPRQAAAKPRRCRLLGQACKQIALSILTHHDNLRSRQQ